MTVDPFSSCRVWHSSDTRHSCKSSPHEEYILLTQLADVRVGRVVLLSFSVNKIGTNSISELQRA